MILPARTEKVRSGGCTLLSLVCFVVKVVTKSLFRFPIPYWMRYDEIIKELFILSTSKGFSTYHYPIAFFQAHEITQHKTIFGRLLFTRKK